MTLPLLFAPSPNGELLAHSPAGSVTSNLAAGLLASADGWTFPLSLLRPMEPLFTGEPPKENEKFLTGLRAENFLGAGVLPAKEKRTTPLAWIGVELGNRTHNSFADVRGGCWVPGYPSIGRGRELLRAAGVNDAKGWGALLTEIGFAEAPGPALYFNFHCDSSADCQRVYVLDSSTRCLHGLALPCSTLAPSRVK